MTAQRMPPTHPGEVLLEEFLKPKGVSRYRLAQVTRLPATRIGEIVKARRGVTADTALRLARAFGTSAEFWMNLQARYDLERARDEEGARVDAEVNPRELADHAA